MCGGGVSCGFGFWVKIVHSMVPETLIRTMWAFNRLCLQAKETSHIGLHSIHFDGALVVEKCSCVYPLELVFFFFLSLGTRPAAGAIDPMVMHSRIQSLWSGPGPSPLERLLEQQKQWRDGATQ